MVKVPDIYPLQIQYKDQKQGEWIIKSIIDGQKLKCQHYFTLIDKMYPLDRCREVIFTIRLYKTKNVVFETLELTLV